mgnify:FL=1
MQRIGNVTDLNYFCSRAKSNENINCKAPERMRFYC